MISAKDKLDVNISSNANLIIGQGVFLYVTFESANPINVVSTKLKFTGASPNITVPQGDVSLTVDPKDKTKATYQTLLTVANENIKENDPIKFTLEATQSNAEKFPFTGTARTVNQDSLTLIFNNNFIRTPNITSPQALEKAKVSTTLIGQGEPQTPLSNVPVFITADPISDFSSCTFEDDNGKPLSLQTMGNYTGLFINSGKDGSVSFNMSPQKATSMVLNIKSWIIFIGEEFVHAFSPLFIINPDIPKFPNSLLPPNIQGGFSGLLTSDAGASDFRIAIPVYPGNNSGDYILFLTKNLSKAGAKREYTDHYVVVGNPRTELGDSNYVYTLPYDIFDYGTPFDINYVVILGQSAGSLTSQPASVTYMGGATYQPDSGIKREYDKCKVYTSYGVTGPEIHEGSVIGYDSIKEYFDNKPVDPNQKKTGLFIEIMGGSLQGQVFFGSKVTLNMYIQAKNRNNKKIFVTQIMPSKADKYTGHLSLVFHIDIDKITGILPYDGGGAGYIWFDYQVGAKSYGEIWSGKIDTRPDAPTTKD
ncbi:hypothetical protein ABLB69_08905 [Xenorhabdus khoisanae]|uniref:Uncharacterized protein n=1 Tax=Xenorhabdus khoisanae TaxID=880157 RepID=A0A0J5IJN7_9GAMM|nr:hypothetical protein [Xenorhabdus khoisanae]KMJ43385.1 hypothetical protein AB204_19975 [Xenorhabdus khoisanae]